jgi:hypothetical protein
MVRNGSIWVRKGVEEGGISSSAVTTGITRTELQELGWEHSESPYPKKYSNP